MGLMRRMQVVAGSVISIGMVGVIYSSLGQRLIDRVAEQDGPFSGVASQIDTIVPLVLSLLLLAILIWMVVSGVREERTVQRRPRR